MKRAERLLLVTAAFFVASSQCQSAVTLDALGKYLTQRGYGGAQLVHPENFYFLPFRSNGRPGNLLVDTGAPTSLIFRGNLRRLDLVELRTKIRAGGIFGRSNQPYGFTTIAALAAGNCTLTNVPARVGPGSADSPFSRSGSDGLLGLRELLTFGAVLDLSNRLIYLRPSRPGGEVSKEIGSMLAQQGYTSVPLSFTESHLHATGSLEGIPCSFVIDTGGYVTLLDAAFVGRVGIHTQTTRLMAESLGVRQRVGMALFHSLRIGSYEIRNGNASVAPLDPGVIGHAPDTAGILGIEYLAMNSAIFDFVGGKMYLRPRKR